MTDPNRKPKAIRKTNNRAPAATPPAPLNKSRHLEVFVKPGDTQDRAVAGMVARGLVTNASTAIRFLQAEHNELSLMDMARELRDQGEAVNGGDFAGPERMLNAQAVALNAIFAEMARRAALNMGEHLAATEIYLRLALKAQSQSRATFETLAAMKNPPVVFARQANFANGPQQVNNGAAPESRPVRAGAPGHAAIQAIEPNEQSGAADELLTDTRTSQATGRAHPRLEPVGEVNRPANP